MKKENMIKYILANLDTTNCSDSVDGYILSETFGTYTIPKHYKNINQFKKLVEKLEKKNNIKIIYEINNSVISFTIEDIK